MYPNTDPYYISPEDEARLERREKIDKLEEELDEVRFVIFGDSQGPEYWSAVERAREIERQLKTLESPETQGVKP